MKVRVMMKTPDALDYGLAEAFADVERGEERNAQWDIAKTVCEKFLKYGECLTVEIDTEAETCTVV